MATNYYQILEISKKKIISVSVDIPGDLYMISHKNRSHMVYLKLVLSNFFISCYLHLYICKAEFHYNIHFEWLIKHLWIWKICNFYKKSASTLNLLLLCFCHHFLPSRVWSVSQIHIQGKILTCTENMAQWCNSLADMYWADRIKTYIAMFAVSWSVDIYIY